MSAKELYYTARDSGRIPADTLNGKTPWQTMKSKLSVHIRRLGDDSIFIRTAPGRFYLRDLLDPGQTVYAAPPWEPPPSSEIVTAFPSSILAGKMTFQGVRTTFERTYDHLFKSGSCVSISRPVAETTEEFKQIITYVLVRKGDQYLTFRRGVYNHTADMLRGSRCIGFGGHVSQEDWDLRATDDAGILQAAARELAEEISLPVADAERLSRTEGLKVVGLLNDDSSSVGRRHFAVVLEYQVANPGDWASPQPGEQSITQLRWIDGGGSDLDLDDFEYWSQLCLRTFVTDLIKAQPAFKVRRRRVFAAPHLLCLVGEIGSGKTQAASTLVKHHGYVAINVGRLVAELINLKPVPETPREEFQAAAQAFIISPDGPKRLAEAISRRTDELGQSLVLIDGIRQMETLRQLQLVRPKERVPVVYVQTAPDIAYQFYRSRESQGADIAEFLRVRDSPVEQEVSLMLRTADAVIYNWFGRGMFVDTLADLMSTVDP